MKGHLIKYLLIYDTIKCSDLEEQMKKLVVLIFVSFGTSSSAFADGLVKRILSTTQTGMGNDKLYP